MVSSNRGSLCKALLSGRTCAGFRVVFAVGTGPLHDGSSTAGMSPYAGLVFSFLSFVVAVPSAIKVFNWTATLYRGEIGFEAPMLYALGFLGLFTIGGLTGLFLASIPIDV